MRLAISLLSWMCDLRRGAAVLLAAGLLGCSDQGRPSSGEESQVPARGDPQVAAASSAEAQAAFQAGRQLFQRQELARAEEELRKAVRLDPGLAEAHECLGKVLLGLSSVWFGTPTVLPERLDEAVLVLKHAQELEPGAADAAYWVGYALALGGESQEAIVYLKQALELDPRHGPALKQLGLVYAADGESAPAKLYLLQARQVLPRDDEVVFQYGQQLEGDGDIEGARRTYEEAIRIHPARPGTYSRLAVVCERLGDSAGALQATSDFQTWSEFGRRLKEAQRHVQETKGGALASLEVGQLYREAGMLESASEWLQRSVDGDPANLVARLALADVLLELGKKEEASERYRSILESDPDNEAAKKALRRATGEEGS